MHVEVHESGDRDPPLRVEGSRVGFEVLRRGPRAAGRLDAGDPAVPREKVLRGRQGCAGPVDEPHVPDQKRGGFRRRVVEWPAQ